MDSGEKKVLLADLYTLRAGISAISVERDEFGEKEKAYRKAKSDFGLAEIEYDKAKESVDFCERVYKEESSKPKTAEKAQNNGSFGFIFKRLVMLAIAALIPWFFYFATSGSYQADKNKSTYVESAFGNGFYWEKYLIASACIVGVCLIGGLFNSCMSRSAKASEYKKERQRALKNAEESKAQLPQAVENYKTAKKTFDIVYKTYESAKSACTKSSQQMYDALVSQFKSVLDIRDWEHIDLIIFNFETGRADTLKEALQQVDRRVQTDEIIDAIESAGHSIAATINVTMRELRRDLDKTFNRLSEQLAIQHTEQMAALGGINRNIERTGESVAKLQSATENNGKALERISSAENLNNALLAKINCDSMALMEDVNYMVFTAPKNN